MDIVNAIAKVRFASARAQRVHLSKADSCTVEMLCLEAGQDIKVRSGPWIYYVVMGTASLTVGGKTSNLSAGHLASTGPQEPHTLADAGEGRLVCLAMGPA